MLSSSLPTENPQLVGLMTPPLSTEEVVAGKIDAAIRNSGHSELRRIQIEVGRDFVVLQGVVSSFYLKQTAQELVRHAAPRHQICNKITVDRPDS